MSQRMQIESPRRDERPGPENSDWCVGDAAGPWDVSFTERLWGTFRRWFGAQAPLAHTHTVAPPVPEPLTQAPRKAA